MLNLNKYILFRKMLSNNDSSDNSRVLAHKLVILGDVAVGKSSIAQR